MSPATASMRDVAQKLVSSQGLPAARDNGLVLNAQLRSALVRFAGVDGFASLLRRAIALSSTTIPALRHAKVGAAGEVEGLEQSFTQDQVLSREASIVVTSHLLDLLVSFIGESLTRRFVEDASREPSSDKER